MERAAGRVSDLMRSLSHKDRLLTLCQLLDGEQSVGALAAARGLAQPAMSQQLARLRAAGLVRTRRAGQTMYYSVPRGELRSLLVFLQRTYCP